MNSTSGATEAKEEATKLLSISEFRHELGIPLVFAKKLIVWGLVGTVMAVDGTLAVTIDELEKARELLKNPRKKLALFARSLGPGLVTGASDDDPSGIATYSAVGAQFGLALIWMCLWVTPLMLAIQETCARIGIVTNRGLAGVLAKRYSRGIVAGSVLLLVIANIANIGADIGAMAASFRLLADVNFILVAALFTAIIVAIEIAVPYHVYVKVLKWLTVSVLAYVATGLIIRPEWQEVAAAAFSPSIKFNKEYLFAMVAFLGTTITPYLFFWQTSEEVEENKLEGVARTTYKLTRRIARMRTDVKTGMILSNVVSFFIILTTASVLFKGGITRIESAEQAAEALRPFAGNYASLLFALGIIGTGFLAVPILAGSAAYALAELMRWREGLEKKFSQAKAFYLVIAISIVIGLSLNFIGLNPMVALYYAAFLNGIIAVPLMAIIMIVGNDPKIMGQETHPRWVKFFGWLAVAAMAVAVVLTFAFSVLK